MIGSPASGSRLIDMRKCEHHLLLVWLIITGLICFLIFVAWREGIFYLLLSSDRSKISVAILLLYFCVTVYCAIRVVYVSSQNNYFNQIRMLIIDQEILGAANSNDIMSITGDSPLPDCLTTDYIDDLIDKNRLYQEGNSATMKGDYDHIEYYASRLKSPHDFGWFAADIMIKMGLLGTIVGFIFMLASITGITDFDVVTMQKILGHMSSGMGTALYTTLAGLVFSVLTAIQYQILDHSADQLIEQMRHLTSVYIMPKLGI